jgi:hypothetical protein
MTSSRPRAVGPAAGVVALVLAMVTLGGCGGSGNSGDGGSAPKDTSARYDGSWSGATSTGGQIRLTVSHGKITDGEIATGDQVFGPECSQVGGRNSVHDIAIEDGRFSWGGEGEGWPVTGTFDSETKAHGTAGFSPDLVGGELPPHCTPAPATWEAVREGG